MSEYIINTFDENLVYGSCSLTICMGLLIQFSFNSLNLISYLVSMYRALCTIICCKMQIELRINQHNHWFHIFTLIEYDNMQAMYSSLLYDMSTWGTYLVILLILFVTIIMVIIIFYFNIGWTLTYSYYIYI